MYIFTFINFTIIYLYIYVFACSFIYLFTHLVIYLSLLTCQKAMHICKQGG